MATDRLAPSARARSRARSSRFCCSVASMVSRCRLRPGAAATTASAEWGASIGIGLRPSGTALALGRRHLVGRHQAGGGKAIEHAVARGLRRRQRPIGPALLGRLRQCHQQRGFRQGQPARLLAEIGERGCPDAFEIAAIGREAEIEREDLILAQRVLDLDRPHHLAQLGREAALGPRLQQAGDLHAQRRGARDDVAVAHELAERPPERQRIDAMMGEKPLVLIGEQEIEEARIDILPRRRQPPAPLIGRIGPQQTAPRDRPPAWNRPAPPPAAAARATRSRRRRAQANKQRPTLRRST